MFQSMVERFGRQPALQPSGNHCDRTRAIDDQRSNKTAIETTLDELVCLISP